MKPLLQTRSSEFNAMRAWARNALRFANTPDEDGSKPATGRKLARGKVSDSTPLGPNVSGGVSMN